MEQNKSCFFIVIVGPTVASLWFLFYFSKMVRKEITLVRLKICFRKIQREPFQSFSKFSLRFRINEFPLITFFDFFIRKFSSRCEIDRFVYLYCLIIASIEVIATSYIAPNDCVVVENGKN